MDSEKSSVTYVDQSLPKSRTLSGGDRAAVEDEVADEEERVDEKKPMNIRVWRRVQVAGVRAPNALMRFARSAYFKSCLVRFAYTVLVIAVLVALIFIISTVNDPALRDYSGLQFNWKVDPSSYLDPLVPPADYNDANSQALAGNGLVLANVDFQYNVLFDAHSHTIYSDGKLTPEQLLQFAIANGYNAIAVTDHNTITGALKAKQIAEAKYADKILVIPGLEYTCCRIHMNFLNIEETIQPSSPAPSDEELAAAIARVHSLGGIVIVNHIPWSNSTESFYHVSTCPNHPSLDQLVSWGVDGFEVFNNDVFDTRTYIYARKHKLIVVSGSDVHVPSASWSWTILNAAARTPEAIIAELKAGRNSFLFDPSGTMDRVYAPLSSSFVTWYPITGLRDYLSGFFVQRRGLYSFVSGFCHPPVFYLEGLAIASFIGWAIFTFVAIEALGIIKDHVMRRIRRRIRNKRTKGRTSV